MEKFVVTFLCWLLVFCFIILVVNIGIVLAEVWWTTNATDRITVQCQTKGFITHGDYNLICERIVK